MSRRRTKATSRARKPQAAKADVGATAVAEPPEDVPALTRGQIRRRWKQRVARVTARCWRCQQVVTRFGGVWFDASSSSCRENSGGNHEPLRELVIDPAHLTSAQRVGDACVICGKKWPRPRARVGRLPSGCPVYACPECAEGVPSGHGGPQR